MIAYENMLPYGKCEDGILKIEKSFSVSSSTILVEELVNISLASEALLWQFNSVSFSDAPFFLLLNLYLDIINANVAEAIAPTIAPIIDPIIVGLVNISVNMLSLI